MLKFECTLRDPVHGDIPLTREEIEILDTPQMQRLRHVRQLGMAYLVYPGAQHGRFEHSVGTAHLATRMAAAVNQIRDQQQDGTLDGYDDYALRVIRLAALVHDATHLPFGHNIEDQTGLLPRHDTPARFAHMLSEATELGRVLLATGVQEQVLSILAPQLVPAERQVPDFWRALVSGTIDADMLDYLARDAMFTGLKLEYDSRIFNVFRVDRESQQLYVELGRQGYLKESVLSEIIRCLEARYYFSERVYYHHAKIAAGSLLAKAVEIVLQEGAVRVEEIQRSTDAGLLDLLEHAALKNSAQRAELKLYCRALHRRELPKRVAVYPVYANQSIQKSLIERFFGSGSAVERRSTEAAMVKALGQRMGREIPVMLYCPAGAMQIKQVKTLVKWPGALCLSPLSEYAEQVPRLRELERSYARGWKFYIHVLGATAQELAMAYEVCTEFFPQAVNVLQRPEPVSRRQFL